jgi:preprotein translocase subunit SecG
MSFWTNILIIVHVLVALGIIGLVLLQHGKGADMGSGFGGGASTSLFGATGSANFLSRATAVLATLFFALSLALAYIASNQPRESGSIMDRVQQQQPAPAKAEEKKEAAPADAAGQKPAPAAGEAKDKNVPQ